MSRVEQAFATARAAGRAAFMPYLTAGFPTEERFLEAVRSVLDAADLIEIGVPYSDPLGDGPTIQRSSQAALAAGATPAGTLRLVERLRRETDKPLVLMSYYNPIYCFEGGEAGFVRAAAEAGADGVILPDLPPEEAGGLITAARAAGLDTVFLAAPTSTPERLRVVTAACTGFIYAVSVTGVTGARQGPPPEVPGLVARLREASNLPVAVGFGVADPEGARAVAAVADGVVVGSALVSRLAEGEEIGGFARGLAAACHRD